ncbi:hypothetical protein KCU83_g131, partial [Aureobasidium melanogenum]
MRLQLPCHGETEDEEDDGVGVKAEVIVAILHANNQRCVQGSIWQLSHSPGLACAKVSHTVALKCDARNSDISSKDGEEKKTSPPVIPLWLVDLESLLEGRLVVVTIHVRARVKVLAVIGRRLRIALAILVRLLVILLLILAILVVGLRGLHRIVLLVIAIRHLVVAVCFTTGHGDSRIVRILTEEYVCAKQGMRPMRFCDNECFCIPSRVKARSVTFLCSHKKTKTSTQRTHTRERTRLQPAFLCFPLLKCATWSLAEVCELRDHMHSCVFGTSQAADVVSNYGSYFALQHLLNSTRYLRSRHSAFRDDLVCANSLASVL